MVVFMERGKSEKNLWIKARINNKLNPHTTPGLNPANPGPGCSKLD